MPIGLTGRICDAIIFNCFPSQAHLSLPSQKFMVNGVPYITTAATSSFHDHDYSREFMEMSVKKFHFLQIDVNGNSMHVMARPLVGNAIDDFSIKIRDNST